MVVLENPKFVSGLPDSSITQLKVFIMYVLEELADVLLSGAVSLAKKPTGCPRTCNEHSVVHFRLRVLRSGALAGWPHNDSVCVL